MMGSMSDPLVQRFRAARRDDELAMLEGFHALKHALRFGAEVEEVVATRPEELERLADGLAPDLAGSLAGRASRVEAEAIAAMVPHAAGEAIEYCYGGGGGWGDPLDRDPQAVLDDVLDELVSRDAAERDYGVLFRGTVEDWDLAVDEDATQRLRESYHKCRN